MSWLLGFTYVTLQIVFHFGKKKIEKKKNFLSSIFYIK